MMRRVFVMVALVATTLAGCGGTAEEPAGSDSASPSARSTATASSPAPERVFTVDELAQALPRTSQVSAGTKKTVSCPGDDSCQPDTASVQIDLERPAPPADQKGAAGSFFENDFMDVSATTYRDAAAATARSDEFRSVFERYDGSFDLPYTEDEDKGTFRPGEKGTGTLTDTTIGDWSGFTVSRVSLYDGGEGNPDGPYQTAQIALVRGSATVSVNFVVLDRARDPGAALAMAQKVATEYVARLG